MNTVLRWTISSIPARPPSRPKPLCLYPPNGVAGDMPPTPLTTTVPDSNSRTKRSHAAVVARVEVGREAVGAVVGLGQDLVLGAEPQDGLHRSEHLVAGQVAAVVDVAEHSGRDEPPVGQITPQA